MAGSVCRMNIQQTPWRCLLAVEWVHCGNEVDGNMFMKTSDLKMQGGCQTKCKKGGVGTCRLPQVTWLTNVSMSSRCIFCMVRTLNLIIMIPFQNVGWKHIYLLFHPRSPWKQSLTYFIRCLTRNATCLNAKVESNPLQLTHTISQLSTPIQDILHYDTCLSQFITTLLRESLLKVTKKQGQTPTNLRTSCLPDKSIPFSKTASKSGGKQAKCPILE